MLRHLATTIALAVVFTLPEAIPADLAPPASRRALPDLTFTDSKGAPVRLLTYKGRVLLLDFWATWCEGCKEEIPWYMEFQDKYKKSGFAAVGVSLDDDGWKSVKPYLQQHKINYRIVVGDWNSAKKFGVDKGMPVTLLIDRAGKVADLQAGVVDKSSFEAEIQILLKEAASHSGN